MVEINNKILFKECLKGKSLQRTLHNNYLSEKSFNGFGIDFGAKNATSSYYRYISVEEEKMTYTDFYSINTDKVKSIDFEKNFKLQQEYDFALVMNTLEHIYNHKKFVENIYKTLKNGGLCEGYVPFMHFYHQDPDDYFRYTHTALKKLLEEAGFCNVKIQIIGQGLFTVVVSLLSRIIPLKIIRFMMWKIALLLDKVLNKFWKLNKNIYIGLAFTATKP